MAFLLAHDDRTFVPGSGIRFESLDFVATAAGDLQLITLLVRGQVLRFGSLSFIANENDNFKPGGPTTPRIISEDINTDAPLDVDTDVIDHRINSYLRPNPPCKEIETMLYTLVNVFSQLMAGSLESTKEHIHRTAVSFPFGLKNVAHGHARKLREAISYTPCIPIFIGMMDYAPASIHDLLDDHFNDG